MSFFVQFGRELKEYKISCAGPLNRYVKFQNCAPKIYQFASNFQFRFEPQFFSYKGPLNMTKSVSSQDKNILIIMICGALSQRTNYYKRTDGLTKSNSEEATSRL